MKKEKKLDSKSPLHEEGKLKMNEVSDTSQMHPLNRSLAYMDQELRCAELHLKRMNHEFIKAEMAFQKYKIQSTVVLFGGARIPESKQEAWAAKNETQKKNLQAMSHYYDEARELARLCSSYSATTEYREFVVTTGGGPGIMEAGNRGAADVGAPTIGLNVVLPHEQLPNNYITAPLCFNFQYLGMRKMHFLIRAKAVAVFPGGFGTLDELFETLTLVQTGSMKKIPILIFGKEFWKNVINIDYLSEQGTISDSDVELVKFVDTAKEAFEIICSFYKLA
ncbi:LOG family protein [Bartonella sp. B30(2025)]